VASDVLFGLFHIPLAPLSASLIMKESSYH
jgi:hypothetical protein